MPYPARLLNEHEQVSLDLRPHWWYFSKHIVTGIPLFLSFLLVWQAGGNLRTALAWIWTALALAWSIWLVFKYLEWRFTFFVVSNQRVVYRTGVLARHGVEIPLSRVNNINFDQSIFNRVIGAGDLVIESAGQEGTTRFTNVRYPDGVQQEIRRQIELRQRTEAGWVGERIGASVDDVEAAGVRQAPDTTRQPPGIAQQIEELAHLRDQGHITAEEFETKKAELLDRM